MSELLWVGLLFGLGLLQVFLPQVWSPLGFVDWLLIAVVHQALGSGFHRSILRGAGAGLIQDGLSGGIVGLHAFSKTAVAAIVTSFGSFMLVRGPLYQGVVAGGATLGDGLIVAAWLAMLGRPQSLSPLELPLRAVATGGTAAFVLWSARRWELRMMRRRITMGHGIRR